MELLGHGSEYADVRMTVRDVDLIGTSIVAGMTVIELEQARGRHEEKTIEDGRNLEILLSELVGIRNGMSDVS